MVLLISEKNKGESRSLKEEFELKGHRTYTVPTTRGDVCTVMDFKEADLPLLPLTRDSYSCLEPDVPYILASRRIRDTETVIDVGRDVTVRGKSLTVIAGPCSVESEEQMLETARRVRDSGATVLRGGAFKPRTSPYAFQGMGVEGLKLLRKAGDAYGMPIITEVLDPDDIAVVAEYSDILQIGARNCQNFSLLKKLGRVNRPVLLKRGMMTTIGEFLMSAEYILSEGNMNVILCERGIRTFETETRNTLDISAIPLLKQKTHLPVIVDPSHAAGTWKIIEPLSLAAIAAGADGLMIEVHTDPARALCDGNQSLKPERFDTLMKKLKPVSVILDRDLV